MLRSSMHGKADAEVAAGDEGFEAILSGPEVAGVVLVLPPHVGAHVCCALATACMVHQYTCWAVMPELM